MQYQVAIPKSHPGLPRLVSAARAMPDVRLEQNGVTIARRQLEKIEAVAEFFEALAEIIGVEETVLLLQDLKQAPVVYDPRNRLRDMLQDASLGHLIGHPSVAGLLRILRGA